jgi:hypothetical protein
VADLVAGWDELCAQVAPAQRGCTVAQALEALCDDPTHQRFERLWAALAEICPHPPTQVPTAQKVGYALRRYHGRVVGGRKLETRVAAGRKVWFVVGLQGQEQCVSAQPEA